MITDKISNLNLQLAQFKQDLDLQKEDPLLKSTGRLSVSAYSHTHRSKNRTLRNSVKMLEPSATPSDIQSVANITEVNKEI